MNIFIVDGLVHGQPEIRTRVNKRTNQNESYGVFTLKNTKGYGDFKEDQYFKVFGRPHHVTLLSKYVKNETALVVQGTLNMKEVQGSGMVVSISADQINFPAKKPAKKNADGSYKYGGGNGNSAAPMAPPAPPPSTPPPAPPGPAPVPAGATQAAEMFGGSVEEDDVPF